MSWEPGRERVRELIDAGKVEQVTPDLVVAHRMLADAGRHLATASQANTRVATTRDLPATTSTMPLPWLPRRAKRPPRSLARMFLPAGYSGGPGPCWELPRFEGEQHNAADPDSGDPRHLGYGANVAWGIL